MRGVRGTALLVAVLTIAVRAVAILKELAIAARFGVGGEVDALLLAGSLPVLLVGVIAGSLPAALVPAIARLPDPAERRRLVERYAGRALVLLVLLTALLVLLAGPLAGSMASQARQDLPPGTVTRLFALMAPTLLLNGYAAYWGAALNGVHRFVAPALLPAVTPLVMVVALLALGAHATIETVAACALAGGALEALAMSHFARRAGLGGLPRRGGGGQVASQVDAQYVSVLVGSALLASGTVVQQVLAGRLGAGAVAVLGYATKLPLLAVGLLGTALATASLPAFSRFAAAGEWPRLRTESLRFAGWTFLVCAAATLVLVLAGEPLVRLLFERGRFDAAATREVALVQAYAALQIPFYCASLVPGRVLSSLQLNHVLMVVAGICTALNVLACWYFGRWLGVAGIALSSTVVYATSASLLWVVALRALRRRASPA